MEYFDEDLFGSEAVEAEVEARVAARARSARMRAVPGRLGAVACVAVGAAGWAGPAYAIGAGLVGAAGVIGHAIWPRNQRKARDRAREQERAPERETAPERGQGQLSTHDTPPRGLGPILVPPLPQPTRRAVVFAFVSAGGQDTASITDMCLSSGITVGRLILLHREEDAALADDVVSYSSVPVDLRPLKLKDLHSHDELKAAVEDVIAAHPFETSLEEYYVHVSQRASFAEACLMMMTQTGQIPGKMIWSFSLRHGVQVMFTHCVIDVMLSEVDRAAKDRRAGRPGLVLETRNAAMAKSLARIQQVAVLGLPIVLQGETGAGKSAIAAWIHELRRLRKGAVGRFVRGNCAVLDGETSMTALFGYVKGAFTGANEARNGWLLEADGGVLFLDEFATLSPRAQQMLLTALDEGEFMPVGSDTPVKSKFMLVVATNADLDEEVRAGRLRRDLRERVGHCVVTLPPLRERPEDMAALLDAALPAAAEHAESRLTLSDAAREAFLGFAEGARWPGNFREFNGAVVELALEAGRGGHIQVAHVETVTAQLRERWREGRGKMLAEAELDRQVPEHVRERDYVEKYLLAEVLRVCRASESASEAGRKLFDASRELRKRKDHDGDRLTKYLMKYGLTFQTAKCWAP